MKRILIGMILLGAGFPACTCEDNLTANPDAAVEVPDAAVDVPDAAVPCEPTGVVEGRVCAPGAREFVAGAEVALSTEDCSGAPYLITATTDADGSFRLENVPAGTWRMEARSGGFVQAYGVTVRDGETTVIPDDQLCIQQDVEIAVITGSGDRIQDLLTALGVEFTLFDGEDNFATDAEPFLRDLQRMNAFDIIFINCAAATTHSVVDPGLQSSAIMQNLREYVLGGGSLYASDWAVVFQALPFPEHIRPRLMNASSVSLPFDANELMGFAPQTVNAEVVDQYLAAALQKDQVSISFPNEPGARSSHWGLLHDVGDDGRVLVRAQVSTCPMGETYCDNRSGPGPQVTAPLALGFKLTPPSERGGNVFYTSFHNIAQQGDDVVNILKYIIFHL